MLARLLTAPARKAAARKLYEALNQAARDPALFADGLLEDDPDGRFEAVALYSAVLFTRLSGRGDQATELAQAVFDQVFKSFDQALRQLGVGDLHVGKRIRKMAESYYGRMHAYRLSLEAGDLEALASEIGRNAFNGRPADPDRDRAVAGLAMAWRDALSAQPDDAVFSGNIG